MQATHDGDTVTITLTTEEAKGLENQLLWVREEVGSPVLKLWEALSNMTPAAPERDARVDAAAAWLHAEMGMQILSRNWPCADGVIHIVARDERTLVAVEVALTPQGKPGRARVIRLRRLAVQWVVANGLLFDEVRVDQITVTRNGLGELAVDEYVKGVGGHAPSLLLTRST